MLDVSREIEADPDEAWDLLTDTTRWTDWGPSVTAVDCHDDHVKPDSKGRIRTLGGKWVPFRITEYEESEDVRRWRWKVAGIPATGHRVEETENGCRVVFELPVTAAFYTPVCKYALKRIEKLLV